MSKLQYATNSQHTHHWIERIGKIIINFSALELECTHWLIQLSEEHQSIRKFMDMQFATKIKHLTSHVEARSTGHRWRKDVLRSLNEASKLAKVRNLVAHNPVMFFWNNSPESGEPDFVGIPNPRKIQLPQKEVRITKSSADRAINEMVALVQKLATLRSEWCVVRDNGGAPPAKSILIKKPLSARFKNFVSGFFRDWP